MTLMMIVFWGVIVAAIVIVVRALSARHRDDPPAANDPGDILDERSATEAVDIDEYQRRRELVHSK
jgi:uncharacterized membrane protein